MVEREDLFHLPFYKKEAFTGSDRGLRFWIGKVEGNEETILRAIVWPEPFALKHTPDEQKVRKDFAFSEEGLDSAYAWIMNEGRSALTL
ncbi:MAG: hypothetical protein LIO86_07235 [Lachnospiraceae bacterium]|nr:hypothetical protein [Lachnospiraceae bacterium]